MNNYEEIKSFLDELNQYNQVGDIGVDSIANSMTFLAELSVGIYNLSSTPFTYGHKSC